LIRAAPLAVVSPATTWELALKVSLGKLRMPEDFLQVVEAEGFIYLPVAPEHAWATRDLPWHHRDPFDRLLVAQARVEGLKLLTADTRLRAYGPWVLVV
jgi:PIN domain nuclease of toxin-antitoxin system